MELNQKEIKSMFGTDRLPIINFSLGEITQKAQEMVNKLSISGMQPKLSVKLKKKECALIVTAEGGEYILKPQTAVFPNIPENENCCMDIAADLKIEVPQHCLLSLKDGSLAYVVKRFDREKGKKIHQEDFLQILGKPNKYMGSIEEIGKILGSISSVPGLDVQLFFERVILNFLIGNGDAHQKNFSIRYLKEEQIRLSPAYDIVCSKLVVQNEEDMALTLCGKKNKIERQDLDHLADTLKIPQKVRYEKFLGQKVRMIQQIYNSLLPDEEKDRFKEIVSERYQRAELA